MKRKKLLAAGLCVVMAVSLAACGGSADSGNNSDSGDSAAGGNTAAGGDDAAADEGGDDSAASDGMILYPDIKLGEDLTDLEATISVYNHRTDMQSEDYPGKTWDQYIADFNKDYPNIKVEVETATDYAESSLLRLQSGEWGDIMMIPAVDAAELST